MEEAESTMEEGAAREATSTEEATADVSLKKFAQQESDASLAIMPRLAYQWECPGTSY